MKIKYVAMVEKGGEELEVGTFTHLSRAFIAPKVTARDLGGIMYDCDWIVERYEDERLVSVRSSFMGYQPL